ncbi:MAG: tRNA (adenosine(37)-N6)-threonylcarbamoyltransferase complex ATPase subunit type 1 TsaE [Desulfobulbaceae bacterium]|jgi:tRNA threonylcarbamoyladenosine biosynthesis protein TsaE|nr:tRNA (adenosine(37)-N6)-threonylcarbamoyltransferase complex ATPase subunit type 1 TsaE [Desulfobulbaceae bacterium]
MSNSITFILSSLEDTVLFGHHIASQVIPGDIIFLNGDLGAGKTTLTQAIGYGLGVPKSCYITSPTFSLLHEYSGDLPLYHMDLYRLSGEEEVIELGFEEYLYGEGVCVIEWPDRLGDLIPANRLVINIETQGQSRVVTLTGHGSMQSRTHLFQP